MILLSLICIPFERQIALLTEFILVDLSLSLSLNNVMEARNSAVEICK